MGRITCMRSSEHAMLFQTQTAPNQHIRLPCSRDEVMAERNVMTPRASMPWG